MLFSLYFVYCVFQILYFMYSSKQKINLETIFNYAFKFRKRDPEEMYNFIVSFSNSIKDNYLQFLQNNYTKEENKNFLENINDSIVKRFFLNYEKEDYQDDYQEKQHVKRDLDKELNKKKIFSKKII